MTVTQVQLRLQSAHGLRIAQSNPPIDLGAAEIAVRALLIALGQDPDSEHLQETPRPRRQRLRRTPHAAGF